MRFFLNVVSQAPAKYHRARGRKGRGAYGVNRVATHRSFYVRFVVLLFTASNARKATQTPNPPPPTHTHSHAHTIFCMYINSRVQQDVFVRLFPRDLDVATAGSSLKLFQELL
jgi:hypothetical protein